MFLLDTQVLVWLLRESPRLGEQARRSISSGVPVYFSAVSLLEVTIKSMIGKLTWPGRFDQALAETGLAELPFTARHARALVSYPSLVGHDPFDRLLLAQATSERLMLITADPVLLAVAGAPVFDAQA